MKKTFTVTKPTWDQVEKQIKGLFYNFYRGELNPDKKLIVTIEDKKKRRSTDISTHFHAHITYIHRVLAHDFGINVTRENIYIDVLLLAHSMGATEGGDEYPCIQVLRKIEIERGKIIEIEIPYPCPTRYRTNKQMMTAVEACHRYAAQIVEEKYGVPGFICPEKKEWSI